MSRNSLLNAKYYSWLCELIDIEHHGDCYRLVESIYRKDFKWFVPNDDNRAFEGRNLREQFCEQNDIEYNYEDFPEEVSMLEVMIALAIRCESILADNPDNKNIDEWFWDMIRNIGLDIFDDHNYRTNVDYIINQKLDTVINRTYEKNGRGGLFPMKHDRKDQRKVELWYQMNRYLVEKYYSYDTIM